MTYQGGDGVIGTLSIPKAERVVDTTSAGDSFNAGYLAAELRGATISDAITAGALLASRVIGARGALVANAATGE